VGAGFGVALGSGSGSSGASSFVKYTYAAMATMSRMATPMNSDSQFRPMKLLVSVFAGNAPVPGPGMSMMVASAPILGFTG